MSDTGPVVLWLILFLTLELVWSFMLYYPDARMWPWGQGHEFCSLYVNVLRTSLFSNPLMDLVHVWYDDRFWSNILQGTIRTSRSWPSGQGHRLRIFMLKLYVKVFRTSVYTTPLTDSVHVWYDDRYSSNILRGTISSPYMTLRSRSRTYNFYVKILRQRF